MATGQPEQFMHRVPQAPRHSACLVGGPAQEVRLATRHTSSLAHHAKKRALFSICQQVRAAGRIMGTVRPPQQWDGSDVA